MFFQVKLVFTKSVQNKTQVKKLISVRSFKRWHPRSVLRPAPFIRIRRLSARVQLPFPRRLRGPRQAVPRDHLSASRLQNQISGELLSAPGQPRMRQHQSHLRLLRRVQATLQHQTLEDIHRLFQLSARGGDHRREDLLLPRRSLARFAVHGADQTDHAAHGRARPGLALRSALERPRQGHIRLGRERPRCFVHVRRRSGVQILAQARSGPHMSRASSSRGRLWVFRQAATGHFVLGAQLLRRIRQCGRHDECRWNTYVLIPSKPPAF